MAFSDGLRPSEKDGAIKLIYPCRIFGVRSMPVYGGQPSITWHIFFPLLPAATRIATGCPAARQTDRVRIRRRQSPATASRLKSQVGKAARNQRVEFAENRIGDNRINVRDRAFTEFDKGMVDIGGLLSVSIKKTNSLERRIRREEG